ncbi:hypothetical protein ABEB36_005008 [Hypothenemus hampei]|uniref:Nose resistant-to-fluoxetine protein N-terminal domain-containing protein n=1 Tax=Hypothenemus hampei TaxID=57062 RepID=A0ABD1F0I4_HYPHA
MKSLIFVSLALIAIGKCEQLFELETIAKNGLDFKDVAKALSLSDSPNITKECQNQVKTLLKYDLQALLQMADSWSKFPYPGALYYASKSDWGNYDECVKVDTSPQDERILGKFCAWGLTLPDILVEDSYYLLAYCVPHKCSASDILAAINLSLPLLNDNYCSSKETDSEIDTGAIIALVIFGTLFAITLLSTLYDVYLFYAEKETSHQLFIAFSFLYNGKKLLQSTKINAAGDQILCFHGMKFISMWWIISGHGFISWFLAPVMDTEYRTNWTTRQWADYINSAHISVDTFFFISGFLMAYLYFKPVQVKKTVQNQCMDVPKLILHRYLRLTPPSAMCFLGSVYLFKYLQDGPFFSYGIHTGLIEPCKKYWWTYFLYIQNYYNFHYGDSLCIPTTWYLSADMQLFLISPLIFIPLTIVYKKSFKLTMIILFFLNVLFLGIPIFTKLQWRTYDPDFSEYDFHSKLISYFIGVMMGIYMRHEKNKNYIISRSLNLLFWIASLATMYGVIYYRQYAQIKNEYVGRSLCYSFTRPMWCIALCWITYACAKGYGGIINWFLSSPFMQVGSKLTYSIYITHGFVIAHNSLGNKTRLNFDDWLVFYQNCGYFVVSMLIATFWSLSYESPMLIVEKLIFGHGKPAPTRKYEAPKPSIVVVQETKVE